MEFAEAVGHEPDLSVCKKANQGDVPQGVDGLDLIGHRRAEGKFASLAGEEQYRVHIWTNSSPPDYRPAVRTRQAGAANSLPAQSAMLRPMAAASFSPPSKSLTRKASGRISSTIANMVPSLTPWWVRIGLEVKSVSGQVWSPKIA